MKITRFDGTEVRIILLQMIVDTQFLSKVVRDWQTEGLFDSVWANTVGNWCVKYFRKFGMAPNQDISKIFELEVPKLEEKTADSIELFLQNISALYDSNPKIEHVVDIAKGYFLKTRLNKEIAAAAVEINNGMWKEAQSRLSSIRPISLEPEDYVNVTGDFQAWLDADNKDIVKPIVSYPEEMGGFTYGEFYRGTFYAFLAPDKTGKSTYLQDFAFRALRRRNHVVYVDLGDHTRKELMRKIKIRSARHPAHERVCKIPIRWDDKDILIRADIQHEAADLVTAYHNFRDICRDEDSFRMLTYPSRTASMQTIDSTIKGWAKTGWKADVVVLDYADILAPMRGGNIDPIETINENWMAMKRLAQEMDCVVITATQTKSSGYTKRSELLGPEDFSGSKTKNAHVNGMLSINISPSEKSQHVARIGWIVRRGADFNPRDCCRVAGCLDIGNPIIISKFIKNS